MAVAKDGLVQCVLLLAVMVHLVKTVGTIAADTASKMILATGLTEHASMAVTLVGLEKRVIGNVSLGLLASNVIVLVEMVARIRCVIPSQGRVPWAVLMDLLVTRATKCALKAILDEDAWRNVVVV